MKNKKQKTNSHSKHPINSRTIAVLGASGFKGRTLVQELEKDPSIKKLLILDRKKPSFELKKAKFYKVALTDTLVDVRLSEIFKEENVHTVVHMAFPTTPPRHPGLAHEIISVGTMYLCNACADAKVKKVILSSNTDLYGALPDNPNFLTEDSPTRGGFKNRYLADKIDAERSVLKLAHKHPEMIVTILRSTHVLGPTIQSYKTRYLSRPIILTILGYDPLVQFIHEKDVITAFRLAIQKDCPGIFNIVGRGVLPLSRVIRLAGKINMPMPEMVAKNLVQLLWYANMSPAPASYLNFLKYLCIADGEKAEKVLGFYPRYSTREALLSFVGAERLREVDLVEAQLAGRL